MARRAEDQSAKRWETVRTRAATRDFVYAVRTTGVYCRPGCGSRLPRRENVEFFNSPTEAERAGFRPCLRCNPSGERAGKDASGVIAACRAIDKGGLTDSKSLAAAAGMSASHFQRRFKAAVGVTPRAYADGRRGERVRLELLRGRSVTGAMVAAGFESSGRFYENAPAMLGMRPATYRAGGAGERVWFGSATCSLGWVGVGASAIGVCAIELGDSAAAVRTAVKARLPRAEWLEGGSAFDATLRAVVDLVDGRGDPALPLDIRGTAFQRRVWKALCAIPPGETRTYLDLARSLGQPSAVRAVARACATNTLAVAIPCHRVIRTTGELAGYRWGLPRKAALLNREAKAGPRG